MPELPEVEVTRRGLLPLLIGRTVTAARSSGLRLRAPIPDRLLAAHIVGRCIHAIDRRAKYLLLRMDDGAMLVIHLGMTGKLGLMTGETPRHIHDHLLLSLDDDSELRFNDSRRFGTVIVWPAAEAAPAEQRFSAREGVEPLGDRFHADHLLRLAHRRRVPVKSLLMNSRLIAGIGNIYANETLFAARIHPLTPAGDLRLEDWQRIVREARRILRQAIEAGGSTIADFLGASGHPGYFQHSFNVYGRDNQPCPVCSHPILKIKVAGRATYLCPACQPLHPSVAQKRPSSPLK